VIHLDEHQKQDFLALQSTPPLILPINEQGDLDEFHLSKLQSTYYSNALDTYFHMHPESLVVKNGLECTVLQSFDSISRWLETQSPCQVIFIYKDLQTQLAERNGWMVSTNPTAHVLTGSSNNAVLLGNVLQGKASFFYVLKYLQKDKAQLQASLISLEQAANHVEQYKSIASDSGSAKRTIFVPAWILHDSSQSSREDH
jgi:hypothetical protein